jgi:hypothetical protein
MIYFNQEAYICNESVRMLWDVECKPGVQIEKGVSWEKAS